MSELVKTHVLFLKTLTRPTVSFWLFSCIPAGRARVQEECVVPTA